MSLAHFISEAKKHTPVLKTKTVQSTQITVSQQPEPVSDSRLEMKRTMAEISDNQKEIKAREVEKPSWKTCQYLKSAGGRQLCRQYMSFCAEEKCKEEFMQANFFDFKKHLKQRNNIK